MRDEILCCPAPSHLETIYTAHTTHPLVSSQLGYQIYCLSQWLCSRNPFLFLRLTWGHCFFAFRERGREREKHWCERETLIGCPARLDLGSYTPGLGIEPATQHVPWPELELATLQLWDDDPTNWATSARVSPSNLYSSLRLRHNAYILHSLHLIT